MGDFTTISLLSFKYDFWVIFTTLAGTHLQLGYNIYGLSVEAKPTLQTTEGIQMGKS